tara:strand:+ start:212 stop:607 length:396 start_codon:yes stop_codon:yes gene_type:complete
MKVEIPVPIADLFDKISILEIKKELILDDKKSSLIQHELENLLEVLKKKELINFLQSRLYNQLKDLNKELWDLCDIRRDYEAQQIFDDSYIQKSRMEYKVNDRRAEIKNLINIELNSDFLEVKSYKKFSHQ